MTPVRRALESLALCPLAALLVAAGCASAQRSQASAAEPGSTSDADLTRILAAKDRVSGDVALDATRKPLEMLRFFGVAKGMSVADLGAGGGYSTELFARVVGPQGRVFAQDTPNWDGPGLQKTWRARLSRATMANTRHTMRQWDHPLPPEAVGLDAVYFVAAYHDVIAEKSDPVQLNQAVFAALRSGGVYAVIDNSAKEGTGTADCERLHRIDEATVKEQVLAAGFKLAGSGDFLRNPADDRSWNASGDPGSAPKERMHTQDRFALRFVKP